MDEDTRNPVEILVEEFLARHRRGESPSIEEYVNAHPGLSEEIEALFPAALLMEGVKRESAFSPEPAPPRAMPELERLGDYRIVRELGRGGMGVVYEAEQESLGRPVALKVLQPWALESPGRLQRFQREAQAAASLHHTNIVQVFGVGQQDDLHYYVMQRIEGRGLDEVVADEEHRLDVHAAARIALQIARALDHAHARGVLHRDVKPANVLLDERGTAWVTDFGLAKVLQDPAGLTEAGDLLGTIRYMPPERFEGASDARGDIYGLGLTLHEMLTGRAAFADQERGSLIRAVRDVGPPPLHRDAPHVPRDLETIVLKSVARDPSDRYGTAADLAEDLERFLADLPVRARRLGLLERGWRWCRRNRTVATLTLVAAASVVLAAVVGWVSYLATSGALERESEGRELAEAATKRAEQNERLSLEALEEIFDGLAGDDVHPPGPDAPPNPEDQANAAMLQSVLAFFDKFAEQNQANPRLRMEAARALRRVAVLHGRQGDTSKARAAFARSKVSLEALREEYPDSAEYARELALTLCDGALWSLGAGGKGDAEGDCLQAVALAEEAVAKDETDPHAPRVLLTATCRLANVLAQSGRDAEARLALGRALTLRDAGGDEGPRGFRVDVARTWEALSDGLHARGETEAALEDLERAVAALRGDRREAPLDGPLAQHVTRIDRRRARLLHDVGRHEEARALEQTLERDRRGAPPGRLPPPRGPRPPR